MTHENHCPISSFPKQGLERKEHLISLLASKEFQEIVFKDKKDYKIAYDKVIKEIKEIFPWSDKKQKKLQKSVLIFLPAKNTHILNKDYLTLYSLRAFHKYPLKEKYLNLY